ncbi:hypothetical protein ADIWIN_3401 [Winogradskyella psychrotolerans RS-3]|uniref:Uncharacterized protein n=1 Tax=Winogradskyella psychrotolerans RS-3 TaxID=641526 RepID=S7WVJ9_9FLAO|nr:T9SS type A sorting domain-containing protein [Winogradskyella psychrotolerans]EPR70754.1 hypothetical protein ADIWIN_3401 [Winogradskyella psychrotolerans RS-3]
MKQFYSTVILVFCLQFGFGQIGFERNVVIDKSHKGRRVTSVLSADIDGDGDIDVLSSSEDNQILWFENVNGLGEFFPHKISHTVYDATFVNVADIDGDGDLDILAASDPSVTYTDKIVWFKNLDGLGNFGPEILISNSASGVNKIISADIDNDGDLDVLSSSFDDDDIAWYENTDGLGSFGNEQLIDSYADYAKGVEVSDIDNDGDLDVLSISLSDHVVWYENINNGSSFSAGTVINSTSRNELHISDIDGDGDEDIFSSTNTSVVWQENLGFGNFSQENIISDNLNMVKSIYTVDFDSDNDLDLLVAAYDDNKLIWFENLDGLGDFGVEQIISSNVSKPISVFADDFDGDSDIDVLLGSFNISLNSVEWYENTDSQGSFSEAKYITKSAGQDVNSVIAVDIDGDFDLDLVSTSYRITGWYENQDGLGDFATQKFITSRGSTSINQSSIISAGDIDGDGDNDLVLVSTLQSNTAYSQIFWIENIDGLGSFEVEHLVSPAMTNTNSSVNLSDIDGDGDLDIAYTSFNEGGWFENLDGAGNFANTDTNIFISDYASSLLLVDLDDDGDMDAVSSGETVMYNNGSGGFSSNGTSRHRYNDYDSKNVIVNDLDNDNQSDLIFAEGWYSLDNDNDYYLEQNIDTNNSQGAVISGGDLDLDGDFDIVSCGNYVNEITWNENLDGLGTFSPKQIIDSNLTNPTSIITVDIDADGDLDLVSTSQYEVILYKNNLNPEVNVIEGNIGLSVNGNDCGSILLNNVLVITESDSETIGTYTTINGDYRLFTGQGNYITEIQNTPYYYTSNPISQTSNFVGIGNTEIIDFCIEPSGIHNDLNISIYPSQDDPRPGFNTTYQIVYSNIGTTQLSGSVSFEFDDSKLNFLNASETVASQTANTLTFDFTDLNPFETRTIDLEFNVFAPPTTNIGDELVATATISPVAGDETEEDNTFSLQQTLIGSYDPNDITVLEGDQISINDADKYLHYLIRFQNTGTASAINVRVETILDDKLDWATIKLESLSHTGRVEIIDETDVSFIFNNINLADSTNDEPNSHGYIAYKIKPKSDVEVGDIISGIADIFFDFNPAIITNTVSTEIVESLSVNEFNVQTIQVFPNPVKNKLEITSSQIIDFMTVVDINGRVLKEIKLSNLEYSLDVSNLTKGVYFLEIQSGDSKSTNKFIKN